MGIRSISMAGKIIFVTGGQRSGKSVFAEKTALAMSSSPVYIATARVSDEEFRRRVNAHQERRGPQWTTYEEPLDVASVPLRPGDTALFDCVTLWATNCFFRFNEDGGEALEYMKRQFDTLVSKGADILFVTNEVGLGGVSPNAMQRHFADLQGAINQYIAAKSEEAYLIVSGIPLKIK